MRREEGLSWLRRPDHSSVHEDKIYPPCSTHLPCAALPAERRTEDRHSRLPPLRFARGPFCNLLFCNEKDSRASDDDRTRTWRARFPVPSVCVRTTRRGALQCFCLLTKVGTAFEAYHTEEKGSLPRGSRTFVNIYCVVARGFAESDGCRREYRTFSDRSQLEVTGSARTTDSEHA